jgi:hypothetical protein
MAVAQRRHLDRDDLQPVVEVPPEGAALHHRLEVGVRRGDDANVHTHALIAADAHELPLFEHPQQLHLRLQVGLADFVQKQRAPVGGLELPARPRVGPGKRAFLVAEQLGFDQARRDRGAVDAQERKVAARRVEVDRARDQLLTDPALAEDEHGRPQWSDAQDAVEDGAHRGGVTDEVLDAVALRDLVLKESQARVEIVALEKPDEPRSQLERVHGPENVVVGPLAKQADRLEDLLGIDDEENRHRGGIPPERLDELFGQRAFEIDENGVVRAALVQLERLSPADSQGDVELGSGQDAADALGVLSVGVEDEDPLLIGGQAAHKTII